MKKSVVISLLALTLLILASSPSVHSEQTISRGQVVSDSIPSNSYKVYDLSEQLPKGCIFMMYFKVDVGSYGYVNLQRGAETAFQWTVGAGALSTLYSMYPYYTTAFITRKGSYALNVTTIAYDGGLNYTFFYDFSDELQTNNTKTIPREGGIASYYADLSSGDKVTLNLTTPSGSDFDMQVFYGYSVYMSMSPAIANTLYENSSKSLSFRAASEGRYFIFVTATTGIGTFNLQSTIEHQTLTYEQLQSSYSQLNSSYEDLKGHYDNLQASYDSLQTGLGNVTMAMYVLTATTVVLLVINVYLVRRKPSAKAETKTQ
jgi:hypothetical protein